MTSESQIKEHDFLVTPRKNILEAELRLARNEKRQKVLDNFKKAADKRETIF